jgi:hypothetical protein
VVPLSSDRISRVPPYSCILVRFTHTGLSPLLLSFPTDFGYHTNTTGLVRVRSPLLTESRLISFPLDNEMFQFSRFASQTYVFSLRYPMRDGFPHSDIYGSKVVRTSP